MIFSKFIHKKFQFAKRFYDCQPSAAEDGPRASAEDEPSLSVHNLLQVDTIEEYMRLSKTLCEIGDPSSKAAKLMVNFLWKRLKFIRIK